MQLAAYIGLLFSLLLTLAFAVIACRATRRGDDWPLPFVEKGQIASTILVCISSILMLIALVGRDYSFVYVYENVDNTLPFLYRITAFWAGRTGSLLFWHLVMSISGVLFIFSSGYREFKPRTSMAFWAFFLTIESFFLLLLTSWSNPFMAAVPVPMNGLGLNPLLQNLGMAFHPPLLFIGYAVLAIPASVALAAMLMDEPRPWIKICRNWNLVAWSSLTAGIILGAWWSYMELGWGGYWAWDPVENASLIPWFALTALLHTAVIERRRGALQRTNVFLMALVFLACIFATYLVRSGIDVQSLHTFGAGGVATPLTIFLLVGLSFALAVPLVSERPVYRTLSGFATRQGMLVMVSWLMAALGIVIIFGTLWPVISKLWTTVPVALDQIFYNRVCLPLFALIMFLYCFCPWLGWKFGTRNFIGLALTICAFLAFLFLLFKLYGISNWLALFSAAAALTGLVSTILLFLFVAPMRRMRYIWGVYAIHFGLALFVLGVSFSGPYKQETQVRLHKGESVQLAEYTIYNRGMVQRQIGAVRAFVVNLEVTSTDGFQGIMTPDRRWYPNSQDSFAEVSVLPSLGDELYSTLLGYDAVRETVTVKISVNPLVNWLWIGGSIMCLAPFFALRRRHTF